MPQRILVWCGLVLWWVPAPLAQSQVESPDDVMGMLDEYQVTREGKLLRYASSAPPEKPELDEVARAEDNKGG